MFEKIKNGMQFFFNWPIDTIATKKSSPMSKVIAGLAIGIFSLLSLGIYAIYTGRSLAKHKVIWIQHELETAIKSKETKKVEEIFQRYPTAEKCLQNKFFVNIFRTVDKGEPSLLHLAAVKGNEEIANILLEHKADPNATNDHIYPLQLALINDNIALAKCLINNKADINAPISALSQVLKVKESEKRPLNFDFIKFLIQKGARVEVFLYFVEGDVIRSPLSIVAKHYDENPSACEEVIKLMYEKNPKIKLSEGEDKEIPPEALKFIQEEALKAPPKATEGTTIKIINEE